MRRDGTLRKKNEPIIPERYTGKPIAVIINDVHVSLKTLKESIAALKMAMDKAEQLDVPLIINGDLHDTKANLRGECTNSMIEVFENAKCSIELNIGNHDRLNEKSTAHSLNFLAPFCNFIITEPKEFSFEGSHFYIIPYYDDVNSLREYLKTIPKGSTLIMHQGLNGSDSGEYFQDRSALNPEDVSDFRVISGHYHRRQDIKVGPPRKGAVGLWSFVGNPYTLTFAEANDPEKGFAVLYDDGLLEFVPTNLRKHVKLCLEIDEGGLSDGQGAEKIRSGDLVWAVVYGPSDLLIRVTKEFLGLPQPFRLELVSTDKLKTTETPKKLDFDSVIDVSAIEHARKTRLKTLWKELVDNEILS